MKKVKKRKKDIIHKFLLFQRTFPTSIRSFGITNLCYTSQLQTRTIVAYRKNKNLADSLLHGKTKRTLKQTYHTCSCKVCSTLHTEDTWSSSKYGNCRIVKNARHSARYSDRHVVYAVICITLTRLLMMGRPRRR